VVWLVAPAGGPDWVMFNFWFHVNFFLSGAEMLSWSLRRLRIGNLGVQITLAIIAGMLAGAALGADPYPISQKDREFRPREILIKRGETLRFINDDGELLHHAYLSSDTFSFDSGDQQPGSKFDVVFTVAGDYMVLCGIHPKMKLAVHVTK
jgi:plastocyanin